MRKVIAPILGALLLGGSAAFVITLAQAQAPGSLAGDQQPDQWNTTFDPVAPGVGLSSYPGNVAVGGAVAWGQAPLVANLPPCAAPLAGRHYTVTDAAAPAWNATVAGGGAVMVDVQCNATNWVVR